MSKTLTKMQLAHLRQALTAATNKKVEEFSKQFSILTFDFPTCEEKISLIFAGKASRRPIEEINRYTSFYSAFTTAEEREKAEADKHVKRFKELCIIDANDIYERAVFKGANEAFEMLRNFQNA